MRTELSRVVVMGVVALAAAGFFAGVASAQVVYPLVTVDENGNGTVVYSGTYPISSTVGQDSGPGGLPNTLIYHFLPLSITFLPGDVSILEPTGGVSDIARFNNDGTGAFYSDSDGDGDLADVGFPSDRWPLQVSINEVGSEGNNGAFYTPNSDQPGYVSQFPGLTYHFISDSPVPEPATMTLLGMGAFGLFGFIRRQRKK